MTGFVLIVALGAGLSYFGKLVGIGAAYKAKMLCSEVFVAGRPPREVLADLEIDDLHALRIIDASIDEQAKEASASFLGTITRTARYRDDAGCALDFGGDDATGAYLETPVVFQRPLTGSGSFHLPSAPRETIPALVAILDDAFSEPDPARPRRTRAVVVVHKGQVIAERYAPGFEPDTPMPGWSMAKSVLNALVGTLVRDGRFSTDAPVPISEWQSPDDKRGSIELNQLLHMTSGLEFDEDMSNPLADVTRMLLAEPDMAAFAAGKRLQVLPGTRWQYSSGNSNIISRAIRNVMDPEAYRRFPREALFEPIGMTSAVSETDASGTFVTSSYMYATAQDWARFGMLYLNNGVWNGDRILPDGWIEYSKKPAAIDAGASYGAHFWLKIPGEYNQTQTLLPADTIHAVGHEGQFVTIVPSYDVVIVRLGKTRFGGAWEHGAFVMSVLSALIQGWQHFEHQHKSDGVNFSAIGREVAVPKDMLYF